MTCVRLLAPLAPPGLLLKVGTGGQEGGIGAVLALLGGADLAVLTWTIDLKQCRVSAMSDQETREQIIRYCLGDIEGFVGLLGC